MESINKSLSKNIKSSPRNFYFENLRKEWERKCADPEFQQRLERHKEFKFICANIELALKRAMQREERETSMTKKPTCREVLFGDREFLANIDMILENLDSYRRIVDLWNESAWDLPMFWRSMKADPVLLRAFLYDTGDAANMDLIIADIDRAMETDPTSKKVMLGVMVRDIMRMLKRIQDFEECLAKENLEKEKATSTEFRKTRRRRKSPKKMKTVKVSPKLAWTPSANNPFARGKIALSPSTRETVQNRNRRRTYDARFDYATSRDKNSRKSSSTRRSIRSWSTHGSRNRD